MTGARLEPLLLLLLWVKYSISQDDGTVVLSTPNGCQYSGSDYLVSTAAGSGIRSVQKEVGWPIANISGNTGAAGFTLNRDCTISWLDDTSGAASGRGVLLFSPSYVGVGRAPYWLQADITQTQSTADSSDGSGLIVWDGDAGQISVLLSPSLTEAHIRITYADNRPPLKHSIPCTAPRSIVTLNGLVNGNKVTLWVGRAHKMVDLTNLMSGHVTNHVGLYASGVYSATWMVPAVRSWDPRFPPWPVTKPVSDAAMVAMIAVVVAVGALLTGLVWWARKRIKGNEGPWWAKSKLQYIIIVLNGTFLTSALMMAIFLHKLVDIVPRIAYWTHVCEVFVGLGFLYNIGLVIYVQKNRGYLISQEGISKDKRRRGLWRVLRLATITDTELLSVYPWNEYAFQGLSSADGYPSPNMRSLAAVSVVISLAVLTSARYIHEIISAQNSNDNGQSDDVSLDVVYLCVGLAGLDLLLRVATRVWRFYRECQDQQNTWESTMRATREDLGIEIKSDFDSKINKGPGSAADVLPLSQFYYANQVTERVICSGKSMVCDGGSHQPPAAYKMKLSSSRTTLRREYAMLQRVYKLDGASRCVVKAIDYFEVASVPPQLRDPPLDRGPIGVLVMERGLGDMRRLVLEPASYRTWAGASNVVKVPKARVVMVQVAEIAKAIHDAGLVWRDLKPENLVLFQLQLGYDTLWKAVDLESALEVGAPLDDGCTPPYAPPEVARARTQAGGEGIETVAAAATFDSWSLGMLLLELLIGDHYFKAELDAMRAKGSTDWEPMWAKLAAKDFVINLHQYVAQHLALALPDEARLVTQLLADHPEPRLSINELLRKSNFTGAINTAASVSQRELNTLRRRLVDAMMDMRGKDDGTKAHMILEQEHNLLTAATEYGAGDGQLVQDFRDNFQQLRSHGGLQQSAVLVRMEASLERLRRQMDGLSGDVKDIKMGGILQFNMLKTILKGEYRLPRFVLVLPNPPQEMDRSTFARNLVAGLKSRVTAVDQVSWSLRMVCPCCRTAVQCGPQGSGYQVQEPKSTLESVAPAMRITLKFLKLCPGVGAVADFLDDLDMVECIDTVTSLFLKQDQAKEIDNALAVPRVSASEGEIQQCQGHEGQMPLQAMELTDHAYRKLEGMLKDQDPELQYVGLVQAMHQASGQTEWVCRGCQRRFETHGLEGQPMAGSGKISSFITG